MSFLLDTDTCSLHLKRPSGLMHRFMQHSGGLFLPTIVLAELHAWAYRRTNPAKLLREISTDFLPDVTILDFDSACAGLCNAIVSQTWAWKKVFDINACYAVCCKHSSNYTVTHTPRWMKSATR